MGVYVPFAKRLPSSCDFCYISLNSCEARDPYLEGRPNNCPLIEVKPHGRLIDADVLSQMFDSDESFGAAVLDIIADTPTIIESEGEA